VADSDAVQPRWQIIATAELSVDADRFQAKIDAAADGAGPGLRDVDVFNELFAGMLSVWRDPADGRIYVIDGHDRFELAKRVGHPTLLVQHLKCETAGEAFCKGVRLNIAQFVQSEAKTLDAIEYRRIGVERAFRERRVNRSSPVTGELLKYYPDLHELLDEIEEDRKKLDHIAGLTTHGTKEFDLVVSRESLITVARELIRSSDRSATKCRLTWDGKLLCISTGHSDSAIPAGGSWPGAVEVSRLWLHSIARKPPAGDPFEIRVIEKKLVVNRFSVSCSLAPLNEPVGNDAKEDKGYQDVPRDNRPTLSDMREHLIDGAAAIMRRTHVRRESLAALVQQCENRPNIKWKMEEQPLNKCLGEAWVLLAPLGVTPDDLKQLVMQTLRDAWK
jgi:hypothetical protein